MEKLGRYDLIRVIGKGAMGMVYEARDPNLDRKVAIKTIKVENLSEEEAAEYELRFRTEARSAARLQHPNIVSVYDSDRDVDVAYLVIEFVNGEDLKHHLDRGDVYTLAQTLSIMGDLLSALDYAHRHGIVHRDVKPANLLLEPGGRVKLADFGVARMQDSGDATRTQGSMVGTLKYMSPEQVQSQPVDARADLFAAGIVLYQLLTGVRPFDGGSDFDILQKITSQNPPPPSSVTPGLTPAIDLVVARALEKSRENRYPSAQAFKDALFAAVHDADADQTIAPRSKTRANRAPNPAERTNTGSASGVSATVTQELELVYWKDITESLDRADFEGFLERFPAGIYADLAKRKLKRLGVADGSGSGSSASLSSSEPGRQDNEDITQALAPRASGQNGPAQVAATPVPQAVVAAPPDAPTLPPPPASFPQSVQEPPAVSDAAPPRAHRRLGAVLAVVVVVLIGIVGYWLWPGSKAGDGLAGSAAPAPSAVAPAAPVPAATEPTPPAQAGAASAAVPVLAPAVVVVESAAPVSAPAPRAAPVAKPSATAVQSAPSASAAAAPKLAASARPTPERAKEAESASSSAAGGKTPPVAPAATNDPRVACKDRWLLAYQICLTRKCADATFAPHPVCVERHEMEQDSKNRSKPGF